MTEQPVPLFNLQTQHDSLKQEINDAALKALNSMKWLLGPETEAFEKEFAQMTGTKYAVSCSSGASAIQIALAAAGIGNGDEVITTPFTFVATTTSVTLAGANFVFADIDPRTYNIDPKDVKRKITKKTKAILPVHLYGYPADMTQIMKIAKDAGLKVIEDCAQSHLALCNGVMTGGIGDAGAFSFYPSKNLGACGDAGAITTNDGNVAELCRSIRHSGRAKDKAYEYDHEGSTLRMDEVQAAILRVKMRHLKQWTENRNRAAALYAEHLKGIPVTPPPQTPHNWSQSFYVYTIRAEKRDALMEHLKKNNIGCAVYYPVPLYKQPVYKGLGFKAEDFPHAERAAEEVLSIPMFPELTECQVQRVCKVIRSFYE
ncbi:MAG: DegT/DnrJ/EryC1/StrS family aminotransferase [Elusimicrobium sp.]|jgi:dTDP-4-amino-4,6-dideoxygalactose transaminase|nr:DegT/DnrJ/EryC1/StrS family aminotransferase [Elusimicrobium sp.]